MDPLLTAQYDGQRSTPLGVRRHQALHKQKRARLFHLTRSPARFFVGLSCPADFKPSLVVVVAGPFVRPAVSQSVTHSDRPSVSQPVGRFSSVGRFSQSKSVCVTMFSEARPTRAAGQATGVISGGIRLSSGGWSYLKSALSIEALGSGTTRLFVIGPADPRPARESINFNELYHSMPFVVG